MEFANKTARLTFISGDFKQLYRHGELLSVGFVQHERKKKKLPKAKDKDK